MWAPGDGGKCDPWLDVNWCEGGNPGDGGCATAAPPGGEPEEFMGVQGCNPGGGGGTPLPPPPPPPTDTCRTGDGALDDPAVKAGLKDLWARSNPDAPQAQRLEQGAWITQNPDGSYGMAPFSVYSQGPCSINGNMNAPPGAVAFVHTHPFTRGEEQRICGALKQMDPATGAWRDAIGPDGHPLYPVYRNTPSTLDRELMHDINSLRARLGQNALAGLIIDGNQMTVYSEDPGERTTAFPRCTY